MARRLAPYLFLLVVSGGCVSWLVASNKSRKAFEQLLEGDEHVLIEKLVINGSPNEQYEFNDAKTTKYLSDAFRSGRVDCYKLGTTSLAMVYLIPGGGPVKCCLYIPEEEGYITICFPLDRLEGMKKYLVKLPQPIPDTVSKALTKLRK